MPVEILPMEMKGAPDERLVSEYREMVQDGVVHKRGSSFNIIFAGQHVIKYAIRANKYTDERLREEFEIGRELKTKGINVPTMHVLSPSQEDCPTFIIMDRLRLSPLKFLGKKQRRLAEISLDQQRRIISEEGFFASDYTPKNGHNCGWQEDEQEFYFFDLESWGRAII